MWFHLSSPANRTMMISRSIRGAGVATLILVAALLTSCAPSVPRTVTPDTPQGTDAILLSSEVTWSGEHCSLTVEPTPLLTIRGPTVQDRPCVSSSFPIVPGHISIRAQLAERTSSEQIDVAVRLRIFDSLHNEIPLTGHFLTREVPANYFTGVTFNGDNPTSSILFVPPPYPLDGGWIPASAKFAQIELYSGSTLEIRSLSVAPTKWNMPLRDRLQRAETALLPDHPWQPIAVNVQGTANGQRAEILEAQANWQPRGPVLLIAQLDPRDLTHDRLSDDAIALLESLKSWHAENPNVLFGVSVNPYLNGVFRKEPLQFHDGIASHATTSIVLPFATAGASLVLLRADDFAPTSGRGRFDFVLSGRHDRKSFRSLADAHAAFIRSVYAAVQSANPATSVAFVPPWYTTFFIGHQPQHARDYLKHLAQNTPSIVPFVWTGPAVRSLWIDDSSTVAFQQMIGTHQVMIWDNTPYARAHKDFWLMRPIRIPLCSMIEPYDVPISERFHRQKGANPLLLVNTGVNPLQRIQLETAQLYLTLNKRYHPESVLKTLLGEELGKEGTELILQLDRLLWLRYSQRELLKSDAPDSGIRTLGNDSLEAKIQANIIALRKELQGKALGLQEYLTSLAAKQTGD
jgi:hypothetical protein